MYKYVVLVLSLSLNACRDNTQIVASMDKRCGGKCYGGDVVHAGKGICNLGTWQCDEEGNITECVGWGAPSLVQCNGQDNDCSGRIDSYYATCTTACGRGHQTCKDGIWLDDCSATKPQDEVCNGRDDDCDGLIDEPEDLPIKYCYTGNPNDLKAPYGDCRPGLVKCEYGIESCWKQKLPTKEVCGDGIDNDCDGTLDNLGGTPKPKDIVVCVDGSGSMSSTITNIQSATRTWAAKYTNRTDLKFALESCPGSLPQEEAMVILRQNLTNATVFNQAVGALSAGYTALEPTIDAIYMTADRTNPLNINWTPGSEKIMIVFGDEEPQTWFAQPPVTVQQAADMAVDAGMRVYIFTSPPHMAAYQPMINGGRVIDIYISASKMESELDSIVNVCK